MTPASLDRSSFSRYPPLGARFAIAHIDLLRRLPLPVLPSFLEQIITYDWKFPAERQRLDAQFGSLEALDAEGFRKRVVLFAKVQLPSKLAALDWLNQPAQFVQRLTPFLWSSQQIDSYRDAAAQLLDGLSISPSRRLSLPRLVIFVAPPDMSAAYPLFGKLRRHGLHFQKVENDRGDSWPLEILAARARDNREPYAHWYLDGGAGRKVPDGGITSLTYQMAEPVRRAVLDRMDRAIRSGEGPEVLHQQLAAMQPAESGVQTVTGDPVMQRFIVDLFTEGSGTQIYSTSFVQWAAREVIRRAQPATLVVRAASRVRGQDLNELVSVNRTESGLDHEGSLIDSDMAAYYTWLELGKLPDAEKPCFLAWFSGMGQAFVSGPSVPTNVSSDSPMQISGVLKMALAQ